MKTLKQIHEHELRDSLLCLARACPVDGGNPEDCILHAVRQMKPAERLQWFNTLGPHALTFLAAYHHVCMGNKLELHLVRSSAALAPA